MEPLLVNNGINRAPRLGNENKKEGEEPLEKRVARRTSVIQLGNNHAPVMRSIRRGTFEWQALIRPFVSDLCFRCITKRRSESEVSFQSYSTNAAVLFVDLSGYSKITSAIAHRGASVLSNVVNAYLERLLKIVKTHGGDVVKFAGDAVLIVWEASCPQQQLQKSVQCAAQCVLQMQQQAGSHRVEGTDDDNLVFRIHCGLCCGELDTEIFVAPSSNSSQRLFHAVSGEPLQQIASLVDFAKAGQVCISKECMEMLGSMGTYRPVNECSDAYILESLELDEDTIDELDEHVDNLIQEREETRMASVEEDFIPPGVVKLLTHSGQAPTQLAQMRNLCVLFIAMTSSGNPVNWLMEIQCILDAHRCPIIQIIDDDKGVHVVAAINLYESVPEASLLALDICHELDIQASGVCRRHGHGLVLLRRHWLCCGCLSLGHHGSCGSTSCSPDAARPSARHGGGH
jgi:class 3 adenylate cyclase